MSSSSPIRINQPKRKHEEFSPIISNKSSQNGKTPQNIVIDLTIDSDDDDDLAIVSDLEPNKIQRTSESSTNVKIFNLNNNYLPCTSRNLNPAPAREQILCTICNRTVDKFEAYQLECGHKFCFLCLTDEVEMENYSFLANGNIKCPSRSLDCCPISHYDVCKIIGPSKFQSYMRKAEMKREEMNKILLNDEKLAEDLNLDNLTCIFNKTEFECSICFSAVNPGLGILLKNCRHQFCVECLNHTVKHTENFPPECPHNDETGNCKQIITEREIRSFVKPEILENYLEKSLKLFEGTANTFHCKTVDCVGFVEIEENVQGFQCQVCKETNCINCKAIHTGKNCEEYRAFLALDSKKQREELKSEKAIRKLVELKKAMYCPQCKIPVMKVAGCEFVTCLTCKLGICWITQKPRNPITINGVLIDGCHCKENGKKCHPECSNCH